MTKKTTNDKKYNIINMMKVKFAFFAIFDNVAILKGIKRIYEN